MATDFELQDRFSVPPAEVAEKMLDVGFLTKVYSELKYAEWTEEKRSGDPAVKRMLRVVPPVLLPSFIRRALGDSSAYREHQEWAEDQLSYSWSVDFDLTGRLQMSGSCTFEEAGDGGCLRRVKGTVKAGIPFIGGRLESYIADQTRKTQTDLAELVARHLK